MSGSAASDAAPGGQVPSEASQLRVVDFGQRVLLFHRGTGERRLLDGRWQLMQDSEGHGILAPVAGANQDANRSPRWASQVLELRVAQQTRFDGQGLAVMKGDEFMGWTDDLRRSSRRAHVFEGSRSGTDRNFISECIHLQHPPKSCSAVVWWDPSYALKELLGLPKYDSWVSRKAERFEAIFEDWGMDAEANLRRSLKAMSAKHRNANSNSTPSPPSKFDMESGDRSLLVSTSGLVTIVSSIGARPKQWRAAKATEARSASSWVIDSIVSRVGQELCGGRFSDLAEFSISIWRGDDGKWLCGDITSTSPALTNWLGTHMGPNGPRTVGESILALAELACHKCRLSSDKQQLLKDCFCFIVWWSEQCADLSRQEAFWSIGNFMRLPEIVGPKAARRRISFDFKRAISQEVAMNGPMRSNAQVVGGAEALKRNSKRNRDDKETEQSRKRAENAGKFTKDIMVGYLHAGHPVIYRPVVPCPGMVGNANSRCVGGRGTRWRNPRFVVLSAPDLPPNCGFCPLARPCLDPQIRHRHIDFGICLEGPRGPY